MIKQEKSSRQWAHMEQSPLSLQQSQFAQPPQSSHNPASAQSPPNNGTTAGGTQHRYSVIQQQQIDDISFERMPNGLVPVVTQDEVSCMVLMVAYCNRQALLQTLHTGYAHYFSRSRNQLWKKGETSGNIQLVQRVLVDCDYDSILYIVKQHGVGACHTGRVSCFFSELSMQQSS